MNDTAMIPEEYDKSREMPMEDYTVRKLETGDLNEITFYADLYKFCASLTELYASQESMDKASEIEKWFTLTSDGIALGCISSNMGVHSEGLETKIFNEISVNIETVPKIKEIGEHLHIEDAGMDSTYVTETMSEFRGKLRAVLIKNSLIRRVSPDALTDFIKQLEKKVSSLEASAEKNSSTQTAGLHCVIGTLHTDSYYSVPARACSFCGKSLLEAFTNSGVNLSVLVEAFNKSKISKKDKKKKKHRSSSTSSPVAPIGPRVRQRSGKFSFLPHH